MFAQVIPRSYYFLQLWQFSSRWLQIDFSDHRKGINQSRVCICYREKLQVKTFQISYLTEYLVCEVNYENKIIFIVTLSRSPSQTDD